MVDTFLFAAGTIAYIAVTLYLGYLGFKHTKDADDYMVAGRKVKPVILALSYGATFISTSAIIGFGGGAAVYGMGFIWLTVLNIGVGIIIAFLIYGKKIRRISRKLNAVTFPDFLGKRFNSPFIQYSVAFMILAAMPLYTAAVMIGGASFIDSTFGIGLTQAILIFAFITAIYVVFGGLIAVMYTDAMQGILMLFGMTVLLLLTIVSLGGDITSANTSLSNMSGLIPAAEPSQYAGGLHSWTAMPDFGSPVWSYMVTMVIMGVGIGVLAQPQLAVRFMTAKDDRAINKAVAVGGPFLLMMTGVAFTVGAWSNVWFFNNTGKVAIAAAGKGGSNYIIPLFINSSTPDIFIVLFMLTLLAAAMSTLSSLLHTMGTSAGYDIYKSIMGAEKASKRVTQIAVFVMLLASIALALTLGPQAGIIITATSMFMELCACAFLPMLTYGLYSKNPLAMPAKISLIIGAVTWFLWAALINAKEAVAINLCPALLGHATLTTDPGLTNLDPIVIGLPISIVALLVGIFVYSSMEKKTGSRTTE